MVELTTPAATARGRVWPGRRVSDTRATTCYSTSSRRSPGQESTDTYRVVPSAFDWHSPWRPVIATFLVTGRGSATGTPSVGGAIFVAEGAALVCVRLMVIGDRAPLSGGWRGP